MAYNTKRIKTDVDGKPIPQVFNPALDEYEALKGDAGAARHILYSADGNPITTTGDKLAVRATEIETQLTTIQGYIDGLEGAIGQAVANPAANTMLARLKNLEGYLDGVESALGTTADVEATGNGSLIAIMKRLRTLLAGGLPAALTAGGGMKVGVVDALPAGANIIGQVKLSDGTDALAVNTNGSINIVPINSAGTELFTDANPGSMKLTGSYVEIGGVTYAVSGGDTIRNTAANKPDAAAAHAVIPFCYYFSVDTGIVEVTDGTKWVVI
jgi:hypothetical protein